MSSDKELPFGGDFSRANLRREVWRQMLRGAGFAGAVVVGIIVLIYIIYLVGLSLPPESKEAFDPSLGWLTEEAMPLNETVETV